MAVTVVGFLLMSCVLLWQKVGAQTLCYQCNNVEMSTDNRFIRELIGGTWKSDPSCEASPSDTVTCDSSEICGYMDASSTISAPLVGSATVKFVWRGCIPRSEVPVNQCVGVNQNIKDIVKITGEVDVDGHVCSCDVDMCDAGCAGFNIRIAGKCLSWWIFIGSGGGLLLLLVTCCCCCCCKCCRSQPTATYLTLREEPRTVVVTNTHLQTTGSPVAAADMQAFPPSYPSAMNVNKGQVI